MQSPRVALFNFAQVRLQERMRRLFLRTAHQLQPHRRHQDQSHDRRETMGKNHSQRQIAQNRIGQLAGEGERNKNHQRGNGGGDNWKAHLAHRLQQQAQPVYANMPGYGPQSYAGFAPAQAGYASSPAYAVAQPLPARRFTVIGGSDSMSMVEEPTYVEESVSWQR